MLCRKYGRTVPASRIAAAALLILIVAVSAAAQEEPVRINYNTTYAFPFSLGVAYQFLSPIAQFGTDYQGDFSLTDISLQGALPIRSIPQLQPLSRFGVTIYKANYNAADPTLDQFDHTTLYLTVGLAYMHKFTKAIELGADFDVGFGYSIYPKLAGSTHGAWDFMTSLGGSFAFNPSYNFSLGVRPNIRYIRSFSPLERFNGFTFGLGISATYRFGVDPDAPQAKIKSIKFSEPHVDDLFAAMQSYYVDNPIGSVSLTNTEKYPLTELTVTFYQAGYMDIATTVETIDELGPGETREIDLYATFNKEVFSMVGVTPLTGEIAVDYVLRTRGARQSVAVDYDLYDKNSMTWDDDMKVAAFMTHEDSALSNYVGRLRQWCKDAENPGYNESVQTAMQVYFGLTEIGCLYQRDPTLSFEDAQVDAQVVDSVNIPRDTLAQQTGDCDDLTVLFNSLLESAGIETGFVTVPGHIYSIFDTGTPAKDYRLIHPDKSMTVNIEGRLWVPVEITFIGADDFLSAWRAGAEEFARYVDDGNKLGLYFTRKAQETYRPVGFEERDLGLQYGDRSKVLTDFRTELTRINDLILDEYERMAKENGNKGSWNTYGIVSARLRNYDRAEKALNTALALDRNYISPKVNLANIYYLREEYQNALRLYHDAERQLEEAGRTSSKSYARLLLNISKTYHEMENYAMAARYSAELARINPELADRYAYLADSAGGRAADLSAARDVLFVEE